MALAACDCSDLALVAVFPEAALRATATWRVVAFAHFVGTPRCREAATAAMAAVVAAETVAVPADHEPDSDVDPAAAELERNLGATVAPDDGEPERTKAAEPRAMDATTAADMAFVELADTRGIATGGGQSGYK